MKIVYMFIICIVTLLNAEKINIAVMELDGNGISTNNIVGLSNRLRSQLFKTGKYNVIERSQMNAILKEQGFQQSGCTNADCAIEVGQIIGVSKIVVGSIDKVGSIYSVDIRLVDVKTGKIEKTATEDCAGCSIDDVLLITLKKAALSLAGIKDSIETKKINEPHRYTFIKEPEPVNKTEIEQIPIKKYNNYDLWKKMGFDSKDSWLDYKISKLSLKEYLNREKRDPSKAARLSAIFPGTGFYYNKNIGAGLLYMIGFGSCLISGIVISVGPDDSKPIGYALLGASPILYAGNIVHTAKYSRKRNKKLEEIKIINKISFQPKYDINNEILSLNVGIDLSM